MNDLTSLLSLIAGLTIVIGALVTNVAILSRLFFLIPLEVLLAYICS